jgi:pyrimidine operon attenuation protein/uracil phosphoribosyltransferase
MTKSIQLMDEQAVARALTRLSFEITEKAQNMNQLVLVGIKTRGVPMAKALAAKIKQHSYIDVPVLELDITFYRDDLSRLSDMPTVREPNFDTDINGKEVIIVDDVLYTGRTIRAAIEAIFSVGRPARIGLAVLIDRGHRELPIKPDYIGKNVPTSKSELIKVNLTDIDGATNVELYKRD